MAVEVRPYWQSGRANRYGVFDTTDHQWLEFTGGRVDGDAAWAVRQVQAVLANPALAVGRQDLIVPPVSMSHIAGLQWNATDQLITGGHRRLSIPTIFTVGAIVFDVNFVAGKPSSSSSYSANIQLLSGGVLARNSRGAAIEKSSEMYPDSWLEADIEAAVTEAFHDAYDTSVQRPSGGTRQRGVIGAIFVGQAGGIWIKGIISRGQIATAYPII